MKRVHGVKCELWSIDVRHRTWRDVSCKTVIITSLSCSAGTYTAPAHTLNMYDTLVSWLAWRLVYA